MRRAAIGAVVVGGVVAALLAATAQAAPGPNLVVNGSFDAGTSGFTSSYAVSTSLGNPATIGVGTDSHELNPYWAFLPRPHERERPDAARERLDERRRDGLVGAASGHARHGLHLLRLDDEPLPAAGRAPLPRRRPARRSGDDRPRSVAAGAGSHSPGARAAQARRRSRSSTRAPHSGATTSRSTTSPSKRAPPGAARRSASRRSRARSPPPRRRSPRAGARSRTSRSPPRSRSSSSSRPSSSTTPSTRTTPRSAPGGRGVSAGSSGCGG